MANPAPVLNGDLRPRAVLSVGMAGHRHLALADDRLAAIGASLQELFTGLTASLARAASPDEGIFASQAPVLRLVCTGVEGGEFLGMRAAATAGAETAFVVPYPAETYAQSLEPSSAAAFREILTSAGARFDLPGTLAEDTRAKERANNVMLANVDVLVAVWDGGRARERGGTGDIVQAAILRGIPVIAVGLDPPHTPNLLVREPEYEFEIPFADDLPLRPIQDGLDGLVRDLMCPPTGAQKRLGYVELLTEPPLDNSLSALMSRMIAQQGDTATPGLMAKLVSRVPRLAWLRPEYLWLLKMFRVTRLKGKHSISGEHAWAAALAHSQAVDRRLPEKLRGITAVADRVDAFAGYYGQLYRSSMTTRILGLSVIALVTAVIGVWAAGSVFLTALQVLLNGLVFGDEVFGNRRRWQERWLDYRSIAERLRRMRYLFPLGLGPGVPQNLSRRVFAWTDWFVVRNSRVFGAPIGQLEPAAVDGMAHQLADIEIPEQIAYHRLACRRLARLEGRLNLTSNLTLAAATFAGVGVFLIGRLHVTHAATWQIYANLILAVSPTILMQFKAYRTDADLMRLVERSAATAAALSRLRQTLVGKHLTYDQLAAAAGRVMAINASEHAEWQSFLESRRMRKSRGRPFTPPHRRGGMAAIKRRLGLSAAKPTE